MLNEFVLNELQELQQEHAGFKIDSLESANWGFRKLRAINEQKEEYKALAQKEIDRITSWLNSEVEKLDNQAGFFNSMLTEYAVEQRRNDPKFKLSSPYGKVSFRKQQPKWIYNEEKTIKFLKNCGLEMMIRVKEEVNKTDLKKVVQVVNGKALIAETGELVEGIEVLEQDEIIKIEVAE